MKYFGMTPYELYCHGLIDYFHAQDDVDKQRRDFTLATLNEWSDSEQTVEHAKRLVELDELSNNLLTAVSKMIERNNIALSEQLADLLNQPED